MISVIKRLIKGDYYSAWSEKFMWGYLSRSLYYYIDPRRKMKDDFIMPLFWRFRRWDLKLMYKIKKTLGILQESKYPLLIMPFEYNGFGGSLIEEKVKYRGRFIKYTSDPGCSTIELEDGKMIHCPGWAIKNQWIMPNKKWENCFKKNSTSSFFGVAQELN